MQEVWSRGDHTVVHVLCDDPAYLRGYMRKFAARMQSTVPSFTLGMNITDEPRDMASSYKHMKQARPLRMTGLSDFVRDVWIMVVADEFVATAGSTVLDLVEGWRSSQQLADRPPWVIGDWPTPTAPTRQARREIIKLAAAVARSNFDPEVCHITHEQMALLGKLLPHLLAGIDATIEEHYQKGETRSTILGKAVRETSPLIRSNAQQFATLAGKPPKGFHWFGALLRFRLNPHLADINADHTWQFSGQQIERIPMASAIATGYTTTVAASGANVPPSLYDMAEYCDFQPAPKKRPLPGTAAAGPPTVPSSSKRPRTARQLQPIPPLAPPPPRPSSALAASSSGTRAESRVLGSTSKAKQMA